MLFKHLLAKSSEAPGNNLSLGVHEDLRGLLAHLQSVYKSAQQILDCTCDTQLTTLGLDLKRWRQDFICSVSLASVFHDLGKANDHFQGMIQKHPDRLGRAQGLRHEWVIYWLMQSPRTPIAHWLSSFSNYSIDSLFAARCAIIGHHPSHGRPNPPTVPQDGAGSQMKIFLSHEDLKACLQWIADILDLPPPPESDDIQIPLVGNLNVFLELKKFHMADVLRWQDGPQDYRRFVALVKACMLAADVGGSAIPVSKDESDWIGKSLSVKPQVEDLEFLIAERIGCPVLSIAENLRGFQHEIALKPTAVTFVRAGCGTGKTLAAYNWVRCCAPGCRVFFCYPTTGTATEGFRGYLYDHESGMTRAGARLFHSRKDVDIEMILAADVGKWEDAAEDSSLRYHSLELWATPIASCTVDQVLSLMNNHRNGLYAWPALASAAFVFDEIHAYDDRLFATLLRFVKEFQGSKILLMTASLPENRLKALQDTIAARGSELYFVDGPPEIEEIPRYKLLEVTSGALPVATVKEAWESGGKVLWVANTVRRALNAAQVLEEQGVPVVIYHSRFRYEDRVNRHKDLVTAFEGVEPTVAICTQVAEMSLDLSATLLVTDLAPVPALIQRLGRLNRRTCQGLSPKPFIVVEPIGENGRFTTAPYTKEDHGDWPILGQQWLKALPPDGASQRDLARAWEEVGGLDLTIQLSDSPWIDGGPTTTVTELREGTPGIPVLLESDADAVQSRTVHMTRVLLPMPPPPSHLDWRNWRFVRGVPVAPTDAIEYDPKRGGQWQKQEP